MESADEATGADELARRCAAKLWSTDRASQAMGMSLGEVSAGRAYVTMRVADDMANGHGICHGGHVATLGDSAFAFACNTYDDVAVAAGFDIIFVSPAYAGDLLCAEAVERVRRGRSGVYDITVWRGAMPGEGDLIAEMRGRSRSLGRPVLDR